MHEWFSQITSFIDVGSLARAIFFSLIGSIMLTQWVKFQFADWLTDKQHQRRVRTFSSFMAMALCLVLSPSSENLIAIISISIVTGLASPTIYWLLVKALYHYLPWTENILSSRPSSKQGD